MCRISSILAFYPQLKIIKITGGWEHKEDRSEDMIRNFGTLPAQMLKRYGLKTSGQYQKEDIFQDTKEEDPALRRQKLSNNLRRAYEKLGKPTLVVIILPNDNASIFGDIKWWADCEDGVRSVCVTPKAVQKNGKAWGQYGDQKPLANIWYVFVWFI